MVVKILFTYYIPHGGVRTLNRQRAKVLAASGVECHFLYKWPASVLEGTGQVSDSRTYITDQDDEIRSLLEKERFDAIIVTSDYMMLERIRLLGYAGTVIYECQGLGTVEQAIGTLLEALPYVHTCCQAVLIPKTDHMKKLFAAIYPEVRRFSFHNCLDAQQFRYRDLLWESDKVVGWVGRIERNKNWRSFLRMAQTWANREPRLAIWMFADAHVYEPDERAAFEQELPSYGLGGRLVIHTDVQHEEMPGYYSRIGDSGGFLCSTSLTEGFGYALLEAMSCRCPVLSSDSDGPRSFVIHNKTGKTYPVDREDIGIREGMDYLRRSKLRDKIRLAGERYVRRRFTPGVYAQHFVKMLQELGVH